MSGRRRVLAGLGAAVAIFGAATAKLMIWPVSGMPAHVDAIVMMAGPGGRTRTAVQLAREHRAPVLVVSQGYDGYGGPCPRLIPGVKLICFDPVPASTRGEAEFASRLARKYHWHSIALVTSTPQDSRARARMRACFAGRVYVVTASIPWYSWPFQIAYEWAASLKMYLLQRGC